MKIILISFLDLIDNKYFYKKFILIYNNYKFYYFEPNILKKTSGNGLNENKYILI